MKIFLLIIGLAFFLIGLQDSVRLLVDSQSTSIFSWLPGGYSLYIGLDIALAIGGILLAKHASKLKSN